MSEQVGGYLQEKDLIEECAKAVEDQMDGAAKSWIERWTFPGGMYEDAPPFPSTPYRDVSAKGLTLALIEVLARRGLLNDLGIQELRKAGIKPPER